MSVTQVAAGCGADVTYAVTNTVGFQFIQFALDGTPISTQQSGTVYLDPGTYTFAVSTADANNCTMYIEEEVTVVSPSGFSGFITVQATPCGGQCTGALMAGANGGAFPYTYDWNIGNTSQVVDNACAGLYFVTVTDANGCISEVSADLVEASPTIDFFNDSIACNGNLFISPTVSGGSGDYSYLWTPAFAVNDPTAQGVQIQQSFPLWVSVTVTDNETGCTASDSVFVSPNIQVNQTVSLCNGPAELALDPGSMVYNWTATDPLGNTIDMSGVAGNSFTPTQIGTYTVMTYYSGCNQVVHEFVVEECLSECTHQITYTVNTDECMPMLCFNSNDGFAFYSWGINGLPISNDQSFCYNDWSQWIVIGGPIIVHLLTWTDEECSFSSQVEIDLSEFLFSVQILPDTIACNGNLGGIGPQVSGGSGDYHFQWEPAATVSDPTAQSPLITASFPQWITVTVTDNETGCTASDSLYFYPNIQTNATVELCSGTAELTLDPGSMVYNWTATDPLGNTIDMSGVAGNSFSATQAGTYTVMTYYSACNQVFHEFEVVAGLEVFLPDTVYTCAGVCEGTAMAIATGGTGSYIYMWSDQQVGQTAVLLCAGTYTVEVWDANGCMISGDVVVLEYPSTELEITYSETTENCITTVCLAASPGFAAYLWSTGSSSMPICGFSAPNTYNVLLQTLDSYGCLYSDSISFTVEAPCDDVWPGDVNFDGIADNEDALWLGLAYDQTGPVRPDASLVWEGQPAPDWNFNFSGINVNLKYADTDGNGTVSFADTVAISLNYGQTHGKTENALAGNIPALWVEAAPDTVAPGNGIVATVHLGSATQPVDSLHGIAFTLTFNDLLVDDADFTIDFSGNVLGTVGSDVMTLRKLFLPDGEVDVAVTRNTLQNFGGYGPLATFHIVTTDNLSGIHELRIGVSGVTAITAHGHAVELATVADTVIIDSDYVGIGEAFGSSLRVWPNPGSGIFRIEGLHGAEMVEVMDATGRSISRRATNGPDALTIDLSEQPDGLYMLRLSGRDGVAMRRLVKSQ